MTNLSLSSLSKAALLALLPVAAISTCLGPVIAGPVPVTDPRVACAVYKAKTKQWKTDQLRARDVKPADPLQEYKNMEAIKDAMGLVLSFLGYSQKEIKVMRDWDFGGRSSMAYFFKDGKRISREISPYSMELERGLMGKESQAAAFCAGLGIKVGAFD